MTDRKAVIAGVEYRGLDLERRILEPAGFRVDVAPARTPDDVIAAAAGADALLVQYVPVDARVLDALDRLRIVVRYGVGVDNVDLDAARRRGVWVANVPDYGAEEVATHALAMLLALLRHLPFHDRAVRDGTWSYQATGPFHRISTLRLGVVGLGRIGRSVVERAAPWFAETVGYDPYLEAEAWPDGVERVELGQLFATADAVTLHLPLSEDTEGLVDASLLGTVPAGRGAYLVNTARGGLVDLESLTAALDDGRLAGAALDVLPSEPPDSGEPVLRHPRTLISPHVAWYSEQSERDLRRQAAESVVAWADEGRPPHPVVEGT